MQLVTTLLGLRISPDPLVRGLPVLSPWPEPAFTLIDFWAWKYGYTIFYSPSRKLWRTFLAAEFPDGVAAALYLVSSLGFLSRSPRDHSLCLITSHPQAFVTSSVEIPPGQHGFLPPI